MIYQGFAIDRRWSQPRSFTLLELLIAIGILVMLGTGLMIALRGGLNTWTQGEARRESSQLAQTIFTALREDLNGATIFRERLGKSTDVEARMLCDFDVLRQRQGEAVTDTQRQRLFLVRTIRGEAENPITGIAGTTLNATGSVDLHGDQDEALEGDLRATGGLMEVAWILGQRKPRQLYRAVRSPIGGKLSLLNWDSLPPQRLDARRDAVMVNFGNKLLSLPEVASVQRIGARLIVYDKGKTTRDGLLAKIEASEFGKDLQKALSEEDMSIDVEEGGGAEALALAPYEARCQNWAQPFASGVLYLGFEFWHQYSKDWEAAPTRFRGQREHGALNYWDSTRGLLQAATEGGDFSLFKGQASANDPSDDILPLKVRVTLVLEEPAKAGSTTALSRSISVDDSSITVEAAGRAPAAPGYVLIDSEWIRYEAVNGSNLVVAEGGRGARGTTACAHDSGASAIFGRPYQTVISLPAASEDWSD